MDHETKQRYSFIIRIWWEAGPFWRGWVLHAGSQEATYVQNLSDLLAFIQARTGELGGQGRGEEEKRRPGDGKKGDKMTERGKGMSRCGAKREE